MLRAHPSAPHEPLEGELRSASRAKSLSLLPTVYHPRVQAAPEMRSQPIFTIQDVYAASDLRATYCMSARYSVTDQDVYAASDLRATY